MAFRASSRRATSTVFPGKMPCRLSPPTVMSCWRKWWCPERRWRPSTRNPWTCSGTGRVVKPRQLTVKIPAGVRDGAVIRAAGRGGLGVNGGPSGDVLVTVHVASHPLFGRKGDDVTLELPITLSEAALGTKLTVPTPSGGTRTIRIPSGTGHGRTFRIRGEGAPKSRGGNGDLLVSTRIEVPSRLNGEQRKLLEQLAELDDTSERDRALQLGGDRTP